MKLVCFLEMKPSFIRASFSGLALLRLQALFSTFSLTLTDTLPPQREFDLLLTNSGPWSPCAPGTAIYHHPGATRTPSS